MIRRLIALWIVVSIVLVSSPVLAPTPPAEAEPAPTISADIFAKWSKVAQCETNRNWGRKFYGPLAYSGGLGIQNRNWLYYGGFEDFGAPTAGHATPIEQVIIARRIQAAAGVPNFVPDQNGCAAW